MAGESDGFQLATKTLQDLVIAFGGLNQTVMASISSIWAALAFSPLVSAASITPDFSKGFNFSLTPLTTNATLQSPSNAKPGQRGSIAIQQDGTGGRTLSYGTAWKWAGATAPTLSTAANALDVLDYRVLSPTFVVGNLIKNVG